MELCQKLLLAIYWSGNKSRHHKPFQDTPRLWVQDLIPLRFRVLVLGGYGLGSMVRG